MSAWSSLGNWQVNTELSSQSKKPGQASMSQVRAVKRVISYLVRVVVSLNAVLGSKTFANTFELLAKGSKCVENPYREPQSPSFGTYGQSEVEEIVDQVEYVASFGSGQGRKGALGR